MIVWRSFGASVIGPGHFNVGKRNQDAWAAFHRAWGDGIAVSDGLGSKPFSDLGSRAACRAAERAVQMACGLSRIDLEEISTMITRDWISIFAPLAARDFSATCLLAFRIGDGQIHMGMLGDGLAAMVKADGGVASLSDDKLEGFSNITAALSPRTTPKDWRWLSMPEDDCLSIVLCTDGVADDLIDESGFIKGFYDSHRGLSSSTASRSAHQMLEMWPTPNHVDDKTIACLLHDEVLDE